MTYIGEIFLLITNLLMAYYHAKLIDKGTAPKHGWWGLLYIGLTALFCYLTKSWELAIASLLLRKVAFDLSLNLFRGKPLFYVSNSTTSLIDKFHNKLFGKKSEVYMAIYFVGLVVINFYL